MSAAGWLFTIFVTGVMAVLAVVAIVSVIPDDRFDCCDGLFDDPRSPEVREVHDQWRH